MRQSSEKCRRRLFGTMADVGLSVSAPTPETLFACAGEALFSAMTDRRKVRARQRRRVRLSAENLEFLLVAWLNQLIYLFDVEGFLARRCRVRLAGETGLSAVLEGEPYDAGRHPRSLVFKAATYHRLSVTSKGRRWLATVVLDV